MSAPMSLNCDELTVAVNGRTLIRTLNMAAAPGMFVCILGPNGVGKTLMLHTLAGIRPMAAGTVRLHGDTIENLDRRIVARRLGLLLQTHDDAFPTTVLETAMMGRHPHLDFWQWESPADAGIARTALDTMDIGNLTERLTTTLSGGERRRLAIATLLVQNPDILLLDEPLNHLDPLHKLQVLSTLSALADDGKIIISSLHDPVLAARFATQILLLFGDGEWAFGTTDEMLTAERLERLYGTPFTSWSHADRNVLLPAF